METIEPHDQHEPIDSAVAARLARLRSMPMDVTQLEKSLRRKIPQARPAWKYRLSQIRPLRAAAAGIAALAIVAASLLYVSGGPAMASPAAMAQMHDDIVSGRTPVMQVDSIESANRALGAQSPQSPRLPFVPAEHVMACCMKNVKNKKVACVLLKDEGVPVTLTVASSADMCCAPDSPTMTHDGMTCHVQRCVTATGSLNMVMAQRNGCWICLIGQTSPERLMELAAKLTF